MRISERQRYFTSNERVTKARELNDHTLEQISTLKRINKVSDDPIGTSQLIRGRDRLKTIEKFQSNIEFSKGFLENTETAVQSIAETLIRAQELAVGLANSTYDESSRDAASKEVRQLMNELVSLGNTTYAGRFVFSGFRTGTPSLSQDGDFLGDDGSVFLEVDSNDFRPINAQARYLFEADSTERGAGHFNMYHCLEMLFDGLNDNNVGSIREAMAELDHQIKKTTSYQASIGSLTQALEKGGQKLDAENTSVKTMLSKVEEVDMFKASSDFKRTETILQSTLMATNKMLQPSLLNFMQ
jgi:flagellar hook-associated protein 3 FlgL